MVYVYVLIMYLWSFFSFNVVVGLVTILFGFLLCLVEIKGSDSFFLVSFITSSLLYLFYAEMGYFI